MTMRNNIFITRRLPLIILFLAFALFMLSMVGNSGEIESSEIAERTTVRLEKRLAKLESYAYAAL